MRLRTLLALFLFAPPVAAQPKQLPPNLVAPTDALSPADERKAFTVPPGFDVQLVASEPDIQKPMQMAWDAKGRLWVTTSHHYPFAAEKGKSTDKVFLLSDFDPAIGKAKKVQTFADDLNIPIGVLPLPDCKSVIVSSVGEIRKYTDADGDGKADKSEVLFTGFGFDDTHGNTNSFTLMPDGWVYACHGFRNSSKVTGKDGHTVEMQSGHTFRFRPDGSRIEVYTRGQVNPFGMAIDPWFNLYTADCHSKPITQLIPGAHYQSFGKPHDGLGFAPHVTAHDHASTGLCGVAWYDADQFPKDYLGCMFVGNVVTNRINFDRIEWKGASPVAKELPDFLTSTDRWFRPVDIKLGPDGALYVADFYNKIVGHYEVDLKHPGRDKDRGRIWRIVWNGKDGKAAVAKPHRADFTAAKDAELLDDLFHANLTVRFLAGHQLRRRAAEAKASPSIEPIVQKLLNDKDRSASVVGWVLFIAEAAENPAELKLYTDVVAGAKNPDGGFLPEHLTGHLVRALNSREAWGDAERQILHDVFKSFTSVHQRRACVEAATLHPHPDLVAPLIDVLKDCPEYDAHLKHAARVALRNCLRDSDAWPKDYDPIYAEVALAIPTEKAAGYLLAQVKANKAPGDKLPAFAEHIIRNTQEAARADAVQVLTQTDAEFRQDVMLAVMRAFQARGGKLIDTDVLPLLLVADRELDRRLSAEGPLTPEDTKRLLGATRVVIAVLGAANVSRVTPGGLTRNLARFAHRPGTSLDLRLSAADALLKLDPEAAHKDLVPLVTDPKAPPELRDRLLLVFAASSSKEARLDARDALKDAPYRTAVAVGAALATTPFGAEDLLTAVKTGKAPARLLQEKVILERLRAAKIPDLDKQVAALTKGLPALDARLADLIKKRSAAFASAKPDREAGAKLFVKHCAACHRVADQGGKIAPQLDGIGIRGLERLLEDTLDPNRNVDQAFRARVITTKDEKTITAMMLRVEGEVLVVADGEGKELRVPTKDIAMNRETMLSPMPANFGDVIPEAEFAHLVAYLLDQRAEEPPRK